MIGINGADNKMILVLCPVYLPVSSEIFNKCLLGGKQNQSFGTYNDIVILLIKSKALMQSI